MTDTLEAKTDETLRQDVRDWLAANWTSTAATVSMPVTWAQVKSGPDPSKFTIGTVPALLRRSKAWRDYGRDAASLRSAITNLVG